MVELALEGLQIAYSELMRRYQRRVLEVCLSVLHPFERAEDAMMLTFERTFFSLHRYDHRYEFAKWILTIARRTAIDVRRAKHRGFADRTWMPQLRTNASNGA